MNKCKCSDVVRMRNVEADKINQQENTDLCQSMLTHIIIKEFCPNVICNEELRNRASGKQAVRLADKSKEMEIGRTRAA